LLAAAAAEISYVYIERGWLLLLMKRQPPFCNLTHETLLDLLFLQHFLFAYRLV